MAKASNNKRGELRETSAEDFNVSKYNTVAGAARLAEIVLTRANFVTKLGASFALADPDSAVKLTYNDELTDAAFDAEAGILAGTFNWKAEIKSGRAILVRLTASYSIFYENLAQADEKHSLAYLAKVGRFATYPYFRGIFSVHAGAAGLSVPPLPSLKERVD